VPRGKNMNQKTVVVRGSVCIALLSAEQPGEMPRLRPGDVVRVNDDIGVISQAEVVIDGSTRNWDWHGEIVSHGNVPTYAVQFRSGTGHKTAWWTTTEFDEIVSLGPFHD
jgi:hypothetical protein